MQTTSGASNDVTAGAQLELKLVGDLQGRFFVPRYQRGYRWGDAEVRRLLVDIWNSDGKPYSLQPVVVKRRSEGEWELVDGQQRLTTLYLILLFMHREKLQSSGPGYSLEYETRAASHDYLDTLDEARSAKNIDFFHLYRAYECIRAWFDANGHRRQHVANKFYGFLFESVQVIWYEAPQALDSVTLFTRLNIGRIALTDAELVKALLLSRRAPAGGSRTDRAQEIAAQWDGIERDLQDDDVWAFVSDASPKESPTRITLLLDTLAGGPVGRDRPRFHTFETLRREIDAARDEFWNRVVDLHSLVLGWFENRSHYHKIGYLVSIGSRFSSIVALSAGCTKSTFNALLDAEIRSSLELSRSAVTALNFESETHKDKCHRLLLLMNVETVRRMQGSSERYCFRLTREERWSLEHIHAQNAESLSKVEQWKEWLRLHRAALAELPGADEDRRAALLARIDALEDPIDRRTFNDVARNVAAMFVSHEPSGAQSAHSVHSISNLALLSRDDNSALNNAVFEVKRQRILELDRRGAYIPVCTRNVFLKYFTGPGAQQVHFWSLQDRESYLDAMISEQHGLLTPYLRPDESQP